MYRRAKSPRPLHGLGLTTSASKITLKIFSKPGSMIRTNNPRQGRADTRAAGMRGKSFTFESDPGFAPLSPQESEDILSNAPIGICKITPEGRYLYASPALAQIFGYNSLQEFIASIGTTGKQIPVDSSDRKELINLLNSQGGR